MAAVPACSSAAGVHDRRRRSRRPHDLARICHVGARHHHVAHREGTELEPREVQRDEPEPRRAHGLRSSRDQRLGKIVLPLALADLHLRKAQVEQFADDLVAISHLDVRGNDPDSRRHFGHLLGEHLGRKMQ